MVPQLYGNYRNGTVMVRSLPWVVAGMGRPARRRQDIQPIMIVGIIMTIVGVVVIVVGRVGAAAVEGRNEVYRKTPSHPVSPDHGDGRGCGHRHGYGVVPVVVMATVMIMAWSWP